MRSRVLAELPDLLPALRVDADLLVVAAAQYRPPKPVVATHRVRPSCAKLKARSPDAPSSATVQPALAKTGDDEVPHRGMLF